MCFSRHHMSSHPESKEDSGGKGRRGFKNARHTLITEGSSSVGKGHTGQKGTQFQTGALETTGEEGRRGWVSSSSELLLAGAAANFLGCSDYLSESAAMQEGNFSRD